jgi:glycosyltransferase involved in cell wall biosynthesis
VYSATVVIPTFNRSGKLLETLEALSLQDFREFHVIISDDGSTDNTKEIVAAAKNNFPFSIDYYSQTNSGASATTNLGVSKAADGLIILLDDDILPAKETIRKHVEFHQTHPGSILSGSADTDPQRTVTDVQRYKLFMETEWKKLRPDTLELISINFNNFIITTANMSFSRDLFLKLNGFNTALRDGYDVDFGFRALLEKIPVYFDSSLKAIHNDQISLRYYAKRQKAYIDSKKIIFNTYPELKTKYKTDIEIRISPFKLVVYKMLRMNFSVRFFESGFFAGVFPKFFRYRIYGSTIAALSLLK